MAFNLVNLLSTITAPTAQVTSSSGYNPFASPDALNKKNDYYAKNKPVPGGYFAGYYNGKPNIVGRKLFIEV